MNTNDLYLEYARVIKMCEGTDLENETGKCVRWKWKGSDKWFYIEYQGHPNFNGFTITMVDVDFALAVLEGKPVFVGDRLWLKDGHQFAVEDDLHIDHKIMSWTPPTPKRTFTLNGVELPCPAKHYIDEYYSNVLRIGKFEFHFEQIEHVNKVGLALVNLLTEARDKP